jgi:hypothetical protein
MENNGSNSSLSKLLPKSITSKRLRRKQHASRESDLGDDGSSNPLSQRPSTLGSEASSTMTGDDDDHDSHSFASRESGIDQDQNS